MERGVALPSNWRRVLIIIGVALIMIALVGAVIFSRIKSKQIIPDSIKKRLSFSVILPTSSRTLKVDKTTVKYSADEKLLAYEIRLSDGNKLVVSEQPTPESFIDIPQSYDKLISSLQQYAAFDTQNGRVFLTRPENLKGGQTAVMNASGVLMFIRPDKDLTDDAWKHLFNNIEIVR